MHGLLDRRFRLFGRPTPSALDMSSFSAGTHSLDSICLQKVHPLLDGICQILLHFRVLVWQREQSGRWEVTGMGYFYVTNINI